MQMVSCGHTAVPHVTDPSSDAYSRPGFYIYPAHMCIQRGISARMPDTYKPAVAPAVSRTDYHTVPCRIDRLTFRCRQIDPLVEYPSFSYRMISHAVGRRQSETCLPSVKWKKNRIVRKAHEGIVVLSCRGSSFYRRIITRHFFFSLMRTATEWQKMTNHDY